MCRATLIFIASYLLSGFIAGKTSFASDESSANTKVAASPSGQTRQERRALQHLAVTLAAGGKAPSSSRGSNVDDEAAKSPLDPTIPDMDCSVDEIAEYVSCYGLSIAKKEKAEHRFTELIDELRAVLPPERWQGAETEPRIGSIRSYTCRDQDSDVQIDIDIVSQWSPNKENSYTVTIFGWTAFAPRL